MLAAARANGHVGGRKRVLSDEQVRSARVMALAGDPVARIARVLGTSRQVVYRAVEGSHGYGAVAS